MADLNDFVRSFGMSGFLITEELRNIEKQYGVEVGHRPRRTAIEG